MKQRGIKLLWRGIVLVALFAVWTVLVLTVDVRPAGQSQTEVGFAAFNCWFHQLTGVHMTVYHITDWLGLVPLLGCVSFGCLGLVQLIRRKRLRKVDFDILLLGVYYILVAAAYLIFEAVPINYRPILIGGIQEASYPSSTTLLVLSVMPTVAFQADHRLKSPAVKRSVGLAAALFSSFMAVGRLISGVHWFTDIVGSVLLSRGLFSLYKSAVLSRSER